MRIVTDARPVLQEATLRGVGRTQLFLYKALAARHPDWSFDMVYQVSNGRTYFQGDTNLAAVRIDRPGDRFQAWQEFWVPWHTLTSRAGLFHAHGAVAPRFPMAPLLTTIHDLTPLEFRKDEANVQEWGKQVYRTAHASHRIVTPSAFVRGEVHRLLQVPLSTIDVAYWGANDIPPGATDPAAIGRVLTQYGVPPDRPYLLHFGMTMARKNTPRTVEAWAALSAARRAGAMLLIVGLEGPALAHFQQMARELEVADSCHCHGYVPEADVYPLLAGASALVYVSMAEGFGLPILDAFGCGAPVIASRATCLPEIAADAAVLVDPYSVGEIRDAMERVLASADFRRELIERGRRRLADFSWTGCAEQFSELMRACVR